MNKNIFFIAVVICLFSSCEKNDDLSKKGSTANKVLLLKVDFLTNTFEGGIIWAGRGIINQPQNILPASQFDTVTTADIVNPTAGFENIFNLNNTVFDYALVWSSVQRLVKVREYLNANPNATVKLFLYTPSVGAGNPADWGWIIFMKN